MYEPFNGGYTHTQGTSASTWTITHNLNTSAPVVDVYVTISGSLTKVLPLSIVATSANVVTVTFSSSYSGKALVA